MKKTFTLLFIITTFLSCSTNDSEGNQTSSNAYNPPSWIIGTWGYKADSGSPEMPLFRFSSDNVCQLVGGMTSLCWKEAIQQGQGGLSGKDKSTSTTYEASIITNNGIITTTVNFTKISSTKIYWNASGVDLELEKLN